MGCGKRHPQTCCSSVRPMLTFTALCGVGLVQRSVAWVPPSVAAIRATGRGGACCTSLSMSGGGREYGRPNLKAMKQVFERSMDGKLIMEYVKELRSRKELLLASLEETGGIITEDIYPIMEELALVNPSGGCGTGSDNGRGHYSAMLPGHWIAASTMVPNVPFVYGQGEKGPSSPAASMLPSNGSGPTCTLAELSSALAATRCLGDFDPSMPVRPLRARLSALQNTVKDGALPILVAIAGFSPATEAAPYAPPPAADTTAEEEEEEEEEVEEEMDEEAMGRALQAAIDAADRGPRAAAAAGGAGVRSEGFGRSSDLGVDGAVRSRGTWGVMGKNHLRWEFDTVGVDVGGSKIVQTEPSGGGEGGEGGAWGGRDLYEFFLDQNMFIVAWKGDSPKAEDAVVFVREEMPR